MATKVIMNLKYTAPTPPKNLQGNKRSEYIARRNFYNLTSDYNYFTYTLNDKKVVKNKDAEHYFTREGTNSGLFDLKGVLSPQQIEELKKKLANTQSIIWHGFISFDESLTEHFSSQENAIKFLNQTFGAFIERTHLKKDNICLYASLHEDTDHRHIHFAFFEEEPKRRDKNGVLGYTKKGLIDARAFDNYLVSADMHLSEHADEYYKARDKALDELKIIRRTQTTKKRNVKLNREIKSLLEKLPKRGRLRYNSPNMAPYRDEIDRVADLIIQGNKGVSTAHGTMLKQFARIDQEVLELVKDNKLAYSDGARLNKSEIAQFGDELPMKFVNLDNVDYLDNLMKDYKARVGNVILGMCKDLMKKDFKRKRRASNFDGLMKVMAKDNRRRRESIIKETCKILASLDKKAQGDFSMSVKDIEKQQEMEKRLGSNVR